MIPNSEFERNHKETGVPLSRGKSWTLGILRKPSPLAREPSAAPRSFLGLLPDKHGKRQHRLQSHSLVEAQCRLVGTADDQRQRVEAEHRESCQTVTHEEAPYALTLVRRQHRHLGQMSL